MHCLLASTYILTLKISLMFYIQFTKPVKVDGFNDGNPISSMIVTSFELDNFLYHYSEDVSFIRHCGTDKSSDYTGATAIAVEVSSAGVPTRMKFVYDGTPISSLPLPCTLIPKPLLFGSLI